MAAEDELAALEALWRPVQVGTMSLDHRIVVPPHSGGGGSLLGSQEQFEQHCGYWLERIRGGVQWIGGGPTFVRNPLVPGFEVSGIGAHGPGVFRHPDFVERLGRFHERVHAAGGYASVQMVLQGGMPIAPSSTLSGHLDHSIPHALDEDEIAWLVGEYAESAALAAEAGADVVELHANHDDVLQWFLSPRTNARTDGWGGGLDGRRRLIREICQRIRDAVDRPLTLGLRLCMDEMVDGGYGLDECRRLVQAFTADGTVDYFSLDVGGNWGAPSYVPVAVHAEAEWAALAGEVRQVTALPVIYVGRVMHLAAAARIVVDGQADLVGMARAHIADPHLVAAARAAEPTAARPCIVLNDCINRRTGEGLPFACAVNPGAGREHLGRLPSVAAPRRLLVVGGGPAGAELAALAAERGHHVELWERSDALGGQLAVAAKARMNRQYQEWIDWQADRLVRLGVHVALGRAATAGAVLEFGADVVALATGATPRVPDRPGVDLPGVVLAGDVLCGRAQVGHRVVVISEDDRAAPLAVADHLAGTGHEVVLVHESPAPSPLAGKYGLGSILARLDREGARLVPNTRAVAFEEGKVHLAHVFSDRRWTMEDVDSVVLACGSLPDDSLHRQLRGQHSALHLLGDAYAPRRVSFATRQAYELARLLA